MYIEHINVMIHQCYYCEQIFRTKEDLIYHLESHSDHERNMRIYKKKIQKLKGFGHISFIKNITFYKQLEKCF